MAAYTNLTVDRHPDNVFVITLRKAPENRITSAFAQEIIHALRAIERDLSTPAGQPGCVITRGSDAKFWSTGLDLHEADTNPTANNDGFYPLLATLLDYPFPTIALLTGHTFGGAVPFALAHDYRVMNASRGFVSMPPVDLGLHFEGIGALPRLKLGPRVARKMLLEAHKWTGKEALAEGIVDALVDPAEGGLEGMTAKAVEVGRRWAPKAKMGVYSLLRGELVGEAARMFREISYVHGRATGTAAKAKI